MKERLRDLDKNVENIYKTALTAVGMSINMKRSVAKKLEFDQLCAKTVKDKVNVTPSSLHQQSRLVKISSIPPVLIKLFMLIIFMLV